LASSPSSGRVCRVKVGGVPATAPSARFVSPSALKVASRIDSTRPDSDFSEATVKSQVRKRDLSRLTPAFLMSLKMRA
jgi:hypothetical protein